MSYSDTTCLVQAFIWFKQVLQCGRQSLVHSNNKWMVRLKTHVTIWLTSLLRTINVNVALDFKIYCGCSAENEDDWIPCKATQMILVFLFVLFHVCTCWNFVERATIQRKTMPQARQTSIKFHHLHILTLSQNIHRLRKLLRIYQPANINMVITRVTHNMFQDA